MALVAPVALVARAGAPSTVAEPVPAPPVPAPPEVVWPGTGPSFVATVGEAPEGCATETSDDQGREADGDHGPE